MATAAATPTWWRKLLCVSDGAPPPATRQLYSRTQASRKNLGHIDDASSTTPLHTKPPGQRTVSFSHPPAPPRIDTTTDDSAALLMGFSTEEPEGGWAAARGWTPTSPKTPTSTVRGKTEAQLLAEEARAAAAEARAEREKAAAGAEAAKAADAESAHDDEKDDDKTAAEDASGTGGPTADTDDEAAAEGSAAAAEGHGDDTARAASPVPAPPHPDVSITAPEYAPDAPSSADHSIRIDFTASPALPADERLSDAGADAAEVLAVEGAGVALGGDGVGLGLGVPPARGA